MVLNFASKIFFKIRSDVKKSKCLSYPLMIHNDLIYQTDKGIYGLLPIGKRIVEKLEKLVDNELIEVGAQKCELPILGARDLWSKTNRWNEIGSELYRLNDRLQSHYCLQPTAEEMFTKMVKEFGCLRRSQFPLMLFQSNQKFRDEPAARYGMLRSKQFLMNDLYSFDCTEEDSRRTYELINSVYKRILIEKLGLFGLYYVNAPTGQIGGDLSHEYHLPNSSAEGQLRICTKCQLAQIKEASQRDDLKCNVCGSNQQQIIGSVEIAHTFHLGTKYSEIFQATLETKQPYFMCCFGIGLTRLIAASIDVFSISEKAMRLPIALNPFKIAIVFPKKGESDPNWQFVQDVIKNLDKLNNLNSEIFVDDRIERSIGKRLIDLNQLGIPHIIVMNTLKTLNPYQPPSFEYFRAKLNSDILEKQENISHAQLYDLAKTL